MRITTQVEYSLRCLVYLAQCDDGPISVSRITRREKLSRDYVEQLLLKLRRAGLVKSTRGARGGYLLAKKPSEIRATDVFSAVSDGPFDDPCARHEKSCHRSQECCGIAQMWADLESQIESCLDGWTIETLARLTHE